MAAPSGQHARTARRRSCVSAPLNLPTPQSLLPSVPARARLHANSPVTGRRAVPCRPSRGTRGTAAAGPAAGGPGPASGPAGAPLVPGEVVNKVPVAVGMTPQLYGYLLAHTREHEVLRQLREATAAVMGAHMQITPEQGALLGLLVELLGAARVVEVGTFTGYSSLAMALALPPGGRLVTLDKDARTMEMARQHWRAAGVEGSVEGVVGPAAASLQTLLEREGPSSYDMAFIDADKRGYPAYFEACLALVRPGGLIAIDNTLFYGRVADEEVCARDKAAAALRALNAALHADPRVSVAVVPIGDGMTLCRRRS